MTEDQLYTILEAGSGVNDMSNTHIPLQRLLHIAAAADANFSQGGIGSSSDGSTAVLAAAAAAALQVCDLQSLQERAAADTDASAVVPDANQPFTLTSQSPADGMYYVVVRLYVQRWMARACCRY